jgi:hypothetical protein
MRHPNFWIEYGSEAPNTKERPECTCAQLGGPTNSVSNQQSAVQPEEPSKHPDYTWIIHTMSAIRAITD